MVGEDHYIFLHWFTDSLANIHWTHTMVHTLCILLWVQRWIERVIKMTLKIQCFKCSHGVNKRYLGILGLPLTLPWKWGVTSRQLVCLIYFCQVSGKPIMTKTSSPVSISLSQCSPEPDQPRTFRSTREIWHIHLKMKVHNHNIPSVVSGSKAIVMVESYRQLPFLSLHLLKTCTL